MGADGYSFAWNLVGTAAANAWADIGTNGLGWFIAAFSPFVAVAMKLRVAPKREKLAFIRSKWVTELRDTFLVCIVVWMGIFCWELCWSIPRQILKDATAIKPPSLRFLALPAPLIPPELFHVPAKPVKPPAEIQSALTIKASIVDPVSPAIVVENTSDQVAQGVIWELILFRARDLTFVSQPTQNIGFVKPHSKSAPYWMFSPGIPRYTKDNVAMRDGDIKVGDSLTGTLIVDCPNCTGVTYIVHFEWGQGGWFSEMKQMDGKLALPKEMTNEGIEKYITGLDLLIPAKDKIPFSERIKPP